MFCKINKDLTGKEETLTRFRWFGLIVFFYASLGWSITADWPDSEGVVKASGILAQYPVFRQNYDNYSPDKHDLELIRQLENKELLVMFGSWCHDSERELPRLLKLLDVSGVKLAALTLLGVDRNKQEPTGRAEKWRLKYTPTIVLKTGDTELGRIIEKPKVSLADDLANMVNN